MDVFNESVDEIQLRTEKLLAGDKQKKKITASAILNQLKKKSKNKEKLFQEMKADECSPFNTETKAESQIETRIPFILKNDEFIESLESTLYDNTNCGSLTQIQQKNTVNSSLLMPKITYDSVSCDNNSLAIYTPTITSLSRKSSCNSVR
jgi:hypothetical protein